MSDDLLHRQVNEVLATALTAEEHVKEAVATYHAKHGMAEPWTVLGITKHIVEGMEIYAVVQCMLVVQQGDTDQLLTYAAHCDLVVHRGDDFVVIAPCCDEQGETSF